MLAVVDQQQRVACRRKTRHHERTVTRLGHDTQRHRLGHRSRHTTVVGDRGQINEEHSVGELRRHIGRRRHCESRLARTAHARHRDEPMRPDHPADTRHIIIAPNKSGPLERQVMARSVGRRWQRQVQVHSLGNDAARRDRLQNIGQPQLAHLHGHNTGREIGTSQFRRHARADDLATVRDAHQTGRPVHRRAEIVPAALRGSSGVQPHPHAQRPIGRPRRCCKSSLHIHGSRDRITRSREGDRERIPSGREDIPWRPSTAEQTTAS